MFKNFFSKIGHLRDNVKKYFRAERNTDYNKAHAYCIQIAKATNRLSKYVIIIAFPT
jgi:hypothetical protein